MQVIDFQKHLTKDVDSAIHYLLDQWESKNIKGLALLLKTVEGKDRASITGHYRRNLENAYSASMQMSRRIAQLQDEDSNNFRNGGLT